MEKNFTTNFHWHNNIIGKNLLIATKCFCNAEVAGLAKNFYTTKFPHVWYLTVL